MKEVIYFQFKRVWETRLPTQHASIVMKKGSHFTRIFSQEIRRLKATGNLDLLRKRYSGSQTCKPPLKEKSLGYEKLSSLFVMLFVAFIISIFVVLLEYITKNKKKKQEITSKDKEMLLIKEIIGHCLKKLSNQEAENLLHSLNQKYFKKEQIDTISVERKPL